MGTGRHGSVLSVFVLVSGCFTGDLGTPCRSENDCPFGLTCFAPTGTGAVCTVRCDDAPCAEGVCLEVAGGRPICARKCVTSSYCPSEGLTYCLKGNLGLGCWVDDPLLARVPAGLSIASVEVWGSTRSSGRFDERMTGLRRGQPSLIRVAVANTGPAVKVTDVGLRCSGCIGIQVDDCNGPNDRCVTSSTSCDCSPSVSLATGEAKPVLAVVVTPSTDEPPQSVRFDLSFFASPRPTDGFTVEVLP